MSARDICPDCGQMYSLHMPEDCPRTRPVSDGKRNIPAREFVGPWRTYKVNFYEGRDIDPVLTIEYSAYAALEKHLDAANAMIAMQGSASTVIGALDAVTKERDDLKSRIAQAEAARDDWFTQLTEANANLQRAEAERNQILNHATSDREGILIRQRDEARAEVERLKRAYECAHDHSPLPAGEYYVNCSACVLQEELTAARSRIVELEREVDLLSAMYQAGVNGDDKAERELADQLYDHRLRKG